MVCAGDLDCPVGMVCYAGTSWVEEYVALEYEALEEKSPELVANVTNVTMYMLQSQSGCFCYTWAPWSKDENGQCRVSALTFSHILMVFPGLFYYPFAALSLGRKIIRLCRYNLKNIPRNVIRMVVMSFFAALSGFVTSCLHILENTHIQALSDASSVDKDTGVGEVVSKYLKVRKLFGGINGSLLILLIFEVMRSWKNLSKGKEQVSNSSSQRARKVLRFLKISETICAFYLLVGVVILPFSIFMLLVVPILTSVALGVNWIKRPFVEMLDSAIEFERGIKEYRGEVTIENDKPEPAKSILSKCARIMTFSRIAPNKIENIPSRSGAKESSLSRLKKTRRKIIRSSVHFIYIWAAITFPSLLYSLITILIGWKEASRPEKFSVVVLIGDSVITAMFLSFVVLYQWTIGLCDKIMGHKKYESSKGSTHVSLANASMHATVNQ